MQRSTSPTPSFEAVLRDGTRQDKHFPHGSRILSLRSRSKQKCVIVNDSNTQNLPLSCHLVFHKTAGHGRCTSSEGPGSKPAHAPHIRNKQTRDECLAPSKPKQGSKKNSTQTHEKHTSPSISVETPLPLLENKHLNSCPKNQSCSIL